MVDCTRWGLEAKGVGRGPRYGGRIGCGERRVTGIPAASCWNADLRHSQPPLLPLAYAASAVPYILDYGPAVWHSYDSLLASSHNPEDPLLARNTFRRAMSP